MFNNCQVPRGCCNCCRGPRGPQGIQGEPGRNGSQGEPGPAGEVVLAYGGLNYSSSQLLMPSAIDTPIQIKFDTELPSNDVAYEANSIKINKSGIYEINYSLLASSSHKVDIYSAVRANGQIIADTRGSHTLYLAAEQSASTDGRLSASTLVELKQDDVLDLIIAVIRTVPSGLLIVVNGNANATLTVKLLKQIEDEQVTAN